MLLCQCTPRPGESASKDYIINSERDWAESVATGDTTALSRILADDFIGVGPKGRVYDKTQMIADTREAPKYFVSNHLNDVKVRFYGDTAIARATKRGSGGVGSGAALSG